MTEPAATIVPTGIKLHRKSRLLEIAFPDDARFMYPCEYLRVTLPAQGGQGMDMSVHGKQLVGITHIEPQGTASLRLDFDDGYSASCTWDALHDLGRNYERNWQNYLQALRAHGLQHGKGRATGAGGNVAVRLLYFIQLAKLAGRDEEIVELPAAVTDVETLLAWLCNRQDGWGEAFAPDRVQVTVNRHFAEPYTLLEHGDEVALVPRPQ